MIATAFALRLGRWGIAGFSALAFLSSFIQAIGFYRIAGHTVQERSAFAHSMAALAAQFTVILPAPSGLDTVGGYVQWRSFGFLTIVFAIWALASASSAARGDEDRGMVETLLAAGLTRLGLIWSRIIGFAASSLIASLAAGLGLIVAAAGSDDSVSGRSVLEAALVLTAVALSCYSLALLVSQVGAARIAAAAAGIVLLLLFLINSLSRNFSSLSSVRWLSPFRYYELNQPLSSGTVDVRATLMLLVIALAGGIAAAVAFAFRDLGSPLMGLPTRSSPSTPEGSRFPLWRMPVARGLYEHRVGIGVWTIGMAIIGALCVALTKSMLQPLMSIPALGSFFGGFLNGHLYSAFLGYVWLAPAQLLFAGFALTHVARWSAEDVNGRLEMILANPFSRTAVLVERALVLTVGATVIAVVSGLAVGYASHEHSIDVDAARLAAASLLLVPFALVFAAAGSVLAAWNPRAALGLLGAFAFASYLISEVGPILAWPEWIQHLSAFKLFGTPLTSGVDRAGLLVMAVIIVVGFGASILLMERRNVGS
ncbi:MAG: hypothetical protein NVS1B3_12970 [Candidatus Dormibacteraceae bacterium]